MSRPNNSEIRLTGDQAKRFNQMAQHPDPEVSSKREAYMRHINETTQIKREGSRVIVTVDTNKKFCK